MEALPAGALALELPAPEDVPWSFLMAFVSLGLVYLLFRARPGLFEDISMGGREVALLILGSIAGGAANVPLWISGETYLMVNIGGTVVALLLVRHWLRAGKIKLLPLALGTAIVTVISWRIVQFSPQLGIVSTFPWFFLPIAGALVFGLLLSMRNPTAGAPTAYAAGSLGALIGADLLHVPEIHAHFTSASTRTIISIGGAGVFDMVFLAGTSAFALHLLVVTIFGGRGAPEPAPMDPPYPPPAITLRDSRRVDAHFRGLAQPNPLERALAGVAMSDIALRDGDYARSVRMSWLAVDNLVQTPRCQAYLGNGVDARLRHDVDRLHATYLGLRSQAASLRDAGEANAAAKVLVSALGPRAGYKHALEGVA